MACLRSLIRKVRSLSALPSADRRCLFLSLLLLPSVALSVKVLGFKRTKRWLAALPGCPTAVIPSDERRRVIQIMRNTRIARSYHRYWTNCLSHSLTLWALLHRERIPCEVRVGSRIEGGHLKAHAWVEWQQETLNDPDGMTEKGAAFDRPLVSR